jgi:hypothetical protein
MERQAAQALIEAAHWIVEGAEAADRHLGFTEEMGRAGGVGQSLPGVRNEY